MLCPNGVSTNCYRLNVTGLSNNTTYSFGVQALNQVGLSDSANATARPSNNAAAQIVQTNTASTLTTCTTASPTQPTCVQYLIPGGAGGVFGVAGGAAVTLPTSFCGGSPCVANTGSQNLGALAGYNNPQLPLILDIKWDSSTIASSVKRNPVCGTNQTALNCFPNNVPIFYEMSFTLLNFPALPSTPLNLGSVRHFCRDPIAQGGANNANWARPKPLSGGLPQFNGYTDSAGSACIKSYKVLTGQPGRDGDKGDIEVQINLTSDSDAYAGRK